MDKLRQEGVKVNEKIDLLALCEWGRRLARGVEGREGPFIQAREAITELLAAVDFIRGYEALPQNRDRDPCCITVSCGQLRRLRDALDRIS